MLTTIECAGHPRDMGLAQGAASRTSIAQEAERLGLSRSRARFPSLRALAVGAIRGEGAGREMFRHFAHLSERLEGIARNADLHVDSILEMHLNVRAGGAKGGLLSRRSTVRATTPTRPKTPTAQETASDHKSWLLERTLPQAATGEADWIVRESCPEVGFRSVEIALPWLVSAVAGVNEGGLAVVGGPLLWGTPGRAGYPTSLLLVQECLQRFEDLDGALDWCSKRPVEGEQSLVLADASGGLATVVISGRECRVSLGEGELHLEGGEPPAVEDAPATAGAVAESREGNRVRLDPLNRRLEVEMDGLDLSVDL